MLLQPAPSKPALTEGRARVIGAAGQQAPIVFVSYSGYEGTVKTVVDTLCRELALRGFEPEFDRGRIGKGYKADPEVTAMMGRCHAAVVVMSKRALRTKKHGYVFSEASVLTRRGGRFPVVPLYVEGLRRERLKPVWDSTLIAERNGVVGDSLQAGVDEVVKALNEQLSPAALPVTNELLDQLVDHDENLLRRVAAPIAGTPVTWYAGPIAQQVATRLLDAAPEPAWLTYENLARRNLETAQVCAHIALPFTWVDHAVARELVGRIDNATPVAITFEWKASDCEGCSVVDLCGAYVNCGWPGYPPWAVRSAAPGWNGSSEELLRGVRDQIAARADDLGIGSAQAQAGGYSLSLVLVVPCDGLDPDVVEAVKDAVGAVSGVAVLFLGGAVSWGDVPEQTRSALGHTRITIDDAQRDGVTRWGRAGVLLRNHRQSVYNLPIEST